MDIGVVIAIVGAIVSVWALRGGDADPGSGDYSGWDADGDGDADGDD